MTQVRYLDEWAEMQPDEPSSPDRSLPLNLDYEEFDDQQLEYLMDYLVEYRLQSILELLKFLLNDAPNSPSEKSKVAYHQRVVCRCALLMRLLNKDLENLQWCQTPKFFNVSSHVFNDCKDEVFVELSKFCPRIGKVMQMRKKSRGAAKKFLTK